MRRQRGKMKYYDLYHAIENTANQNTGKPLYIRRHYTQPSHRALRSYSRRNLVSGAILQFLSSVVDCCLSLAMSEPNFSLDCNFEDIENPAANEDLNDKTPLTDREVDVFVEEQRNPRTVKKTNSDVSKFVKFIQEPPRSEERSLTEIPPAEMDNYLCHFILEMRKADGEEYEPDSLTSFRNSIERHLRQQQYEYSLIESREFAKHREVLKAKRKELKGKGKGRKPNASNPLSREDRVELFTRGFFGSHNPQTLQATVWLNNTLHFGMRSCQEHYDLKWGDVTEKTTLDGKVYLIMEERISKGRDGAVAGAHSHRDFKPKMFASGEENCPVETYRVYRQRRPEPMLDKNAPFYLQAIVNPKGDIWYKNQRLGINSLGKLLKGIGEKAGLNKEKNVTNHSARKTMLNDLCEANVPSYRIIQLSGHKRVDSIEDYHRVASITHQEEMSRILSENTSSSTSGTSTSNTSINKMNAVTQQQCQSSVSTTTAVLPQQTQLFGAHATITGGTFTITC